MATTGTCHLLKVWHMSPSGQCRWTAYGKLRTRSFVSKSNQRLFLRSKKTNCSAEQHEDLKDPPVTNYPWTEQKQTHVHLEWGVRLRRSLGPEPLCPLTQMQPTKLILLKGERVCIQNASPLRSPPLRPATSSRSKESHQPLGFLSATIRDRSCTLLGSLACWICSEVSSTFTPWIY